jgi:hypothetical protein
MHRYAILICILKCCFLVKLFEKWLSVLPLPPVARLTWATHLAFWQLNLAFLHVLKRQIQTPHRVRVAWVALWRAFPQTQRISFLPRSP